MPTHLKDLEKFSTNVRKFSLKASITRILLKFLWFVSPPATVRLVKNHVFSPADYRTVAEEDQILKNGMNFYIEVNGKVVRGWKWGEGPSVLLVHGWNGRGIQLSRFIAPLIQAGFSVLTFDAPGHGASEGKTSSYFELTDTIRALLDPQNDFNITGLIAHSLGGAAVINALSKEKLSLPGALIAPAIRLRDVLFNTFGLYGIPEVVYREAIGEFEQRFGYTLENDDPWKLLPATDSDMLIIHDRQDRSIPIEDSRDAAKSRPMVMLHETEGLGHRRILTDRKTVELVTGYISSQSTAERNQYFHKDHKPWADRQSPKASAVEQM